MAVCLRLLRLKFMLNKKKAAEILSPFPFKTAPKVRSAIKIFSDLLRNFPAGRLFTARLCRAAQKFFYKLYKFA